MPTAQLTFKARSNDASVEEVLAQLKKLEGVISVAKSDTVEGVEGFVIFTNPELAAAARNDHTDENKRLFVLEDPAREAPAGRGKGRKTKPEAAGKKQSEKLGMCVGDFFNGPSPSTMRDDHIARGRGRGAGRGGAGGRGGGRKPEDGPQQDGPRGRGRGGRGRGGPRGPRVPMVKAHVACVHNVPYNATNNQVFQAFKMTGHIYDIARSEHIALLYMAEEEMVTNAILAWNGKQFQGAELAVCGGGTMRIPVPPPPPGPPGPMPPHPEAMAPPPVTA